MTRDESDASETILARRKPFATLPERARLAQEVGLGVSQSPVPRGSGSRLCRASPLSAAAAVRSLRARDRAGTPSSQARLTESAPMQIDRTDIAESGNQCRSRGGTGRCWRRRLRRYGGVCQAELQSVTL